ncbi:hypothetical protein [Mycolicibacterium chubuense]|uniref:Outer membrane channel protein CpnT-like N-terminal domain-containing protein n=1 Tax=Mycolicibacterium chubuense TaxID=1800 RepID=A0A0J6WPV7_MYCCU|nr:hypothetical protein [Mycolicibacterium chubuense]KMO84143.1 hypothetical protein MCHUDSM44219_00949 [Mycolicibacterium chubuense]SPX99833.1 Uncharacterised protein [Mycolicibacterium chubuense]
MTLQDVDTDTYYAVGTGLFEKAGKLYSAFNVNVGILGTTGSMAGTDESGVAWAASYDERAAEVLGAANDLIAAMENYGGVIIQAGYNHAVAEHNATAGNQGAPPTKPPEPPSTAGVLTTPPSAGGPGRGLLDTIGLMQQVGVPVPDGDTDKVSKAADAWDRMATVYQTTSIAEALEVDARAFRDTHSPEVEIIVRDLEQLRDATSSVVNGCAELAQSCRDYASALGDLRTQLEGILGDLAVELAMTAAIGVAASFVSFGVGGVAATAKAAQSITKFARIIAEAVGAWKITKNISRGVKRAHDIAGLRQKLQRIKNLGRKGKPEGPPPPRNIGDLFAGRIPKASELENYANSQGWAKVQTPGGPPKYVDENGVVRMTIKEGSPRTPGSEAPHVELRDATGQRIDPNGNPVTRRSEGNHTPILWDW